MNQKKSKSPSRRKQSHLEARFKFLWEQERASRSSKQCLELAEEVTLPGRKFRFDFHVVGKPVLIEVQGGVFASKKYGHSTGSGIQRDAEKARFALYQGYATIALTSKDITEEELRKIYDYCLTINELHPG